jgi:nucleoside-diphosphate-sugar epimerase
VSILVTGANGFIGRALCGAWAPRGRPVRALVRRAESAPEGTVPAVASGLSDLPALADALHGVHTVLQLAARVHVMRDRAADSLTAFRAVNVEGTRMLLESAIEAGVRRFIYFSSVKAVGEFSDTPWTEAEPPRPVDPYGISKLEAERLVLERGRAGGLAATVLRLPLGYGPGAKANILRLFDLVARGVPLPFGAVENRRSLLFTGNLVAAVDAVLNAEVGGETLFVSDGADLSTPELVHLIARGLGVRPRLLGVPAFLFGLLPSAVERRLVGSLAVDIGRLRRLTGYFPPYTPEEGIAQMARWYRAR